MWLGENWGVGKGMILGCEFVVDALSLGDLVLILEVGAQLSPDRGGRYFMT